MDLDLVFILPVVVAIVGMAGWMISSLAELHRKVDNLLAEMREFRRGKR